jgi:hypothetical protein
MNRLVWVTPLVVLIIYACTGTETQNPGDPLKSFQGSGCKKEAATTKSRSDTATAAQILVSTDYSAETLGLKCVAWETVGSSGLKIDLYNFEGACGADWTGQAALENDGSLKLALVNPECSISKCGICVYDWSFEVEGVDTSRPVSVNVGLDTCPGEQALENYTALLPVAQNSSGILCNYADFGALGWQAAALSECGTQGMPCQGTAMCQTTTTSNEPSCLGDLVCTNNGNTDESVCAKPCSSEEDCGQHGVLTCKNGLCRPKSTW